MDKTTDYRPSPIAGQWYPGNAQRLRDSLENHMDVDVPSIEGEIVALVAPHAGHVYSGPVAGYAYAAVRGRSPDLVAVIAPMHHPHMAPLVTCGHEAYKTPLGPIPIDRDAVKDLNQRLESALGFGLTPVRNDSEHALEIQLPFLQHALGSEFTLLPVMLRDQSEETTAALGQALAQTLERHNALLVASTDLSHFHSQETARKMDGEFLRRLENYDPAGLLRGEKEGKTAACGRGAVATVLWASKHLGADSVKVLEYATSGDVTGDYARVVGYGSAVITRS
jgi:hypothetical protein